MYLSLEVWEPSCHPQTKGTPHRALIHGGRCSRWLCKGSSKCHTQRHRQGWLGWLCSPGQKHFRSTNEKDQNWLFLWNMKQKEHHRDTFLPKFENYVLLADYNNEWLIELLETNTDKDIVMRLILEKGCYMSLQQFKQEHASSFLIPFRKEWWNRPRQGTLMPWTLML